MTTEDDFQKALDAAPEDWQTRLVFADWLQDRDDPRAEGYRALAVVRRVFSSGYWLRDWSRDPTYYPESESDAEWAKSWAMERDAQTLPVDWHILVGAWDVLHRTRREADDAAAHAFAKLPPDRRAELLASPIDRT